MATAKLFKHGGSQAVRLPKEFRLAGKEVTIEKRGSEIVLKPIAGSRPPTLSNFAQYMRENFPHGTDFPDIERPSEKEIRDVDLD
jgi:antitoxin VapB